MYTVLVCENNNDSSLSIHIYILCRMPQVRILLVNTKVPRSTKKMVAGVRELHTKAGYIHVLRTLSVASLMNGTIIIS